MNIRIGQGQDLHRLAPGEELIIGGIQIPHDLGTVAHSDGDVLLHSIIDALLGSLALGDLGAYFPDTEPHLRGIASHKLLERILKLKELKGVKIINLDTTIHLQSPKLSKYIPLMRKNIGQLLSIDESCVSIKAKTGECCDSIGRHEAISCDAIILIEKTK